MAVSSKNRSLVEIMLNRAEQTPNKQACTFTSDRSKPAESITYAMLDTRAKSIAAQLQARCRPGDRAMLLYPPGIDYIVAFWGCLYAKVIAVPVYMPQFKQLKPADTERLDNIIQDASPAVILTNALMEAPIQERFKDKFSLESLSTSQYDLSAASNWKQLKVYANEIAFLQYTSGSSGDPKGVQLSHANLLDNLKAISHSFRMSEKSKGVIWLPPYHDMGLIGGILAPIYNGFSLTLMSPQVFMKYPLYWLKVISQTGATISGGPNFAYELCIRQMQAKPIADLDLSAWDVAFCGAEPVRVETINRFIETFSPYGFQAKAFQVCYGLAESTLLVSTSLLSKHTTVHRESFDRLLLTRDELKQGEVSNQHTFVSNGEVIPHHDVRIVNPETCAPVAENHIGEIWVTGPSVASGYWNQPELSQKTFAAQLAPSNMDNRYWLRTGDLGFMYHNELFVTGRKKDIVIIHGRNFHAHDLEHVSESAHVLLRPNASAAFTIEIQDQTVLVLVQEVRQRFKAADYTEVVIAIRQALMKHFSVYIDKLILVKPGVIPKTTSGKVQRSRCKGLYHQGKVKPCFTEQAVSPAVDATKVDTESFVFIQRLISALTGIGASEILGHASLKSYGIDSIQTLSIIHKINERYNTVISQDAFADDLTVNDLTDVITYAKEPPRLEDKSKPILAEYEANPSQQAIYFHEQVNKQSTIHNVAKAVRFDGEVKINWLTQAIETVVVEFPHINTNFVESSGRIVQKISEHAPSAFWQFHTISCDEKALEQTLAVEAKKLFDIKKEPLVRFHLYETADSKTTLLLVAHHLILDFWSVHYLLETLEQRYLALSRGEKTSRFNDLSTRDNPFVFSQWYVDYLHSNKYQADSDYWLNHFENNQADLSGKELKKGPTAHIDFSLDESISKQLVALGKRYEVTPYVIFLSLFQCLLYQYTKQEKIVIGSPITLRDWEGADKFVGYCINLLPIQTESHGSANYDDVLRSLNRKVKEILQHKAFPFLHLVQAHRLPRISGRMPFIEHNFVYYRHQTYQDEAVICRSHSGSQDVPLMFDSAEVTSVDIPHPDIHTLLNLIVTAGEGKFTCQFEYDSAQYTEEAINDFVTTFNALLANILQDPKQTINTLTYSPKCLTPVEQAIRARVNDTAYDFKQKTATIDGLFHLSQSQYPEHDAIVTVSERITYRQLGRWVNQLSHYLVETSPQRGTLIAVLMEKGPEQIIACLSIMSIGCAYLPLEPDLPINRINEMLNASHVEIILTQEKCQPIIQTLDDEHYHTLAIDHFIRESTGGYPDHPVNVARDPTDLAYVIFTSGSTGMPKGVMMEHHSVVNTLLDINQKFKVTQTDKVFALSSLSFDLSVYDIFGILAVGGTIVLPQASTFREPASWVRQLIRESVTIWNTVPMLMQMLLDYLTQETIQTVEALRHLRLALLSGDFIPLNLLKACRSLEGLLSENDHNTPIQLVSLGGATECAIWSIHHEIEAVLPHWKTIPYGKPLANQTFHILDECLNPCPDFTPGVLYIGGVGLARGYWQDPIKTNAQFITYPKTGERLYRTGDLGQYWPDGTIEFIGREDNQVKLNGYRIELSEIQYQLSQFEGVMSSLPMVIKTGKGQHIVTYVVYKGFYQDEHGPSEQIEAIIHKLKRFLDNKLPHYMLPQHYIFLKAYPLTDNGKLDRTALEALFSKEKQQTRQYIKPQNKIQQTLYTQWQKLLDIEVFSIDDNFFSLGGNSLIAVNMASEVSQQFNTQVNVETIFQYQTIEGLASYLATAKQATVAPELKPIARKVYQHETIGE